LKRKVGALRERGGWFFVKFFKSRVDAGGGKHFVVKAEEEGEEGGGSLWASLLDGLRVVRGLVRNCPFNDQEKKSKQRKLVVRGKEKKNTTAKKNPPIKPKKIQKKGLGAG